MNFKLAKLLLDIRNYTLKFVGNLQALTSPAYFCIWHPSTNEIWEIPLYCIPNIRVYFHTDKEFILWLNHKTQNIKIEEDLQRYMNLKAFL